MIPIDPSEITPEHVYRNRRHFLKAMGFLGTGALLAACAPGGSAGDSPTAAPGAPTAEGVVDEPGDPANSFDEITTDTNYYECTTNTPGVARLAAEFPTAPWSVAVGGLVNNPKTSTIEDLLTP